MNQNSCFVFDLDGTLLNDSKKVDKLTIDTIRHLHQENIICVATGRNYKSAKSLLKEIDLPLVWICSNGAFVYSKRNYNCFIQRFIPKKKLDKLFNILYSEKIGSIVHFGKKNSKEIFFAAEINDSNSMYCNNYSKHHKVFNLDREKLPDEVYTVCAVENISKISKVYNLLINTLDCDDIEINVLDNMKNNLAMLEITTKIDKKIALECYLEEYVKEEVKVIAFGDDNNDKTLLEYADIGVAMKNASEQIKKIANYKTKYDNNESGVAIFIKNELNLIKI